MQSDLRSKLTEENAIVDGILGSLCVSVLIIGLYIMKFYLYGLSMVNFLCTRWQAHQLVVNYSYGFIKRAFLGTIVDLIVQRSGLSFVKVLIYFMDVEELIFAVSFMTFLLYLIFHYKDKRLNLMVLMFFSTGIMSFYFMDWGEPDLIMFSLTLLSVLLIIRRKALWLVPVMMVTCVLIHEGFVLLTFATVVGLLFYRAVSEEDKASRRYMFGVLIATCIICGCLFFYLYFFTSRAITVPSEVILDKSATLLGFPETYRGDLLYTYYGEGVPGSAMWVDGAPTIEFWSRFLSFIAAMVALLPVFYGKCRILKEALTKEKNKWKKLSYVFLSLQFVLTLLMVIVHTDLGRWVCAIVLQEFLTLFALYMIGDKIIKNAFIKTVKCNAISLAYVLILFTVFAEPDKQMISYSISEFVFNLLSV